jgi:hypothetical protein
LYGMPMTQIKYKTLFFDSLTPSFLFPFSVRH